jgi:hypothetical protein
MSRTIDSSFPVFNIIPPHSRAVSEQIEQILQMNIDDDTRTPDDFWCDYFDEATK